MAQVDPERRADMIVGAGSLDEQSQRSSTMVRVLTAMSWCGRSSSKLWHKSSNMDSRRSNSSNGNRIAPSDPSPLEASTSDKENIRPSPVDVVNRSDEMTDAYRLFCPICMYYYAEALKTKCCHHHMCTNCTAEMLWRQEGGCSPSLPDSQIALLSCPHCATEGMRVSRISGSDNYRKYEDSPGFNKSATRSRTAQSSSVAPSPLKIGDTYENMMKKMLTYDQCGINIKASASIVTSTPGRSTTPVPDDSIMFPLPGAPFPPLPEDGSLSQRGSLPEDAPHLDRTSLSNTAILPPRAATPPNEELAIHIRSLASLSMPPELQRPVGRPPRAAVPGMEGVLRLSSSRAGSRAASPSVSRAASPSLCERPPASPLASAAAVSVPRLLPLDSPGEHGANARLQSPGRALVYMVAPDDVASPRDDTPRGEAANDA